MLGALFLLFIPSTVAAAVRSVQSSALWRVVHDLCVVDFKATGLPAPCVKVDLAGRYAVLKDLNGKTQMLLIPTDRVAGIESAYLLTAAAPNYFALAWRARDFFEHRAGREVPRDDIALAINSAQGRSQDQLHIHIDGIRPDVRAALAAAAPGLTDAWSPPNLLLGGRSYRALRVDGVDLKANPFQILAALPEARGDMADQTLVVSGWVSPEGKPGFIVLAHRADLPRGDQGEGEELMDHDCAVLRSDAGGAVTTPPP